MNAHVFAEEAGKLRLVGDFDALYESESDPWSQSAESGPMAEYYDFSRRRLVETLRHHRHGQGLEIGCGHGHLTAALQRYICVPVTGMDISPAAIAKAKELHPTQRFLLGNVIAREFEPPKATFQFAVWGQCLWYLLHEIDRAIENTLRCIDLGGLFVISQAFLKDQRYGTHIANGFEGALDLFHIGYMDRLRLIEARYDDTERYVHRDGLLIFRVI